MAVPRLAPPRPHDAALPARRPPSLRDYSWVAAAAATAAVIAIPATGVVGSWSGLAQDSPPSTGVVTVPDVVGRSGEDARAALSAQGLSAFLAFKLRNCFPDGAVYAQEPAAGSMIAAQGIVWLSVSVQRTSHTPSHCGRRDIGPDH
jgi:hypothetical protein